MNMLTFFKKSEIYFLITLTLLNLYLAFALRGEQFIDSTHLMVAVIMLIFVNDKLTEKIKKD